MRMWWTLLAVIMVSACSTRDTNDSLEAPALANADEIFAGTPDPSTLPEADIKADEVLPSAFDLLTTQSAVRDQGQRPICSAFAFIAMMESIYIVEEAGRFDFSEAALSHINGTITAPDNQAGGWPIYTNAQSLSRIGVTLESVWPFDGRSAAQSDEAPSDFDEAPRYFVGYGNYIAPSTLSVKSHLTSNHTPVFAAVRYLRHAWHEQDADAWHRGIVTTPTDDEASVPSEAAHAILLVGWDDDMTATRRDSRGREAEDEEGHPLVDQGFFLFKNSWGTDGWGRDNSRQAGYGWISYDYIARFSSTYVSRRASTVPLLESCDDGNDNDGDLRIDCNDVDCRSSAACPDGFANMLVSSTAVDIPDDDANGITSELNAELTGNVQSLRVITDITHPYRGDLHVTLAAPDGAVFTLSDREGGASDDLDLVVSIPEAQGHSAAGTWTLHVRDLAADDIGRLNSWTLLITATDS